MLCEDIRRMLRELDYLESLMNNSANSQSDRSEAAQRAQDLAGKIREHRETHAGCDYKPAAKGGYGETKI